MDSGQVVIHAVMQSAYACHSNINKVEDLALSQEDKPRKQSTMENCMTD